MTGPVDRERLLTAALAYADVGWPIFPLRPGDKRPAFPNHTATNCDGSDRRCADGHTGWEPRATLDTTRIEAAWRHRPYGIGIACGPASLLVVDLDVTKGGQPSGNETLSDLEREHDQELPATWTVGTPSGGRHLYYTQPRPAARQHRRTTRARHRYPRNRRLRRRPTHHHPRLHRRRVLAHRRPRTRRATRLVRPTPHHPNQTGGQTGLDDPQRPADTDTGTGAGPPFRGQGHRW